MTRDEAVTRQLAQGYRYVGTSAGDLPIKDWHPYGLDDWQGVLLADNCIGDDIPPFQSPSGLWYFRKRARQ